MFKPKHFPHPSPAFFPLPVGSPACVFLGGNLSHVMLELVEDVVLWGLECFHVV